MQFDAVLEELRRLSGNLAIRQACAEHADLHERGNLGELRVSYCEFCTGNPLDSALYLLDQYHYCKTGSAAGLAKLPSSTFTPLRMIIGAYPVWRFSYELRYDCNDMISGQLKRNLGRKVVAAVQEYSCEYALAEQLATILADREIVCSWDAERYVEQLDKSVGYIARYSHIKPAI